jgi:hypothetical protein
MRVVYVLGACATFAAALNVSAPARALTVQDAPHNTDGSTRFADPDARFDQQADAYENGRWGGNAMMFGDGARSDAWAREEAQTAPLRLRDPGDLSCQSNCSSVDVDGVLMLRQDNDAQR